MTDRYEKWLQSVEKNWGSLEAYKEAARIWGKSGGDSSGHLTGKRGGLNALTPEQRSAAGKKGHAAMVRKLAQNYEKLGDL